MEPDPVFLHYVGTFLGIIAILFITLDIEIMQDTNWNVLTSRIFLKKEMAMRYLAQITYLLALGIFSLAAGHTLSVFRQHPYVIGVMQLVGTASTVTAVVLTYYLKKELVEGYEDND